MEKCQKCGAEEGGDLRTLWMACFYAMGELNIPFEECAINGVYCKKTGDKKTSFGLVPVFSDGEGELFKRSFYTLRVCKSCRADWMSAIKGWWDAKTSEPEGCGSCIFVRRNGTTVEITQEEWEKLHGTEVPVRLAE